MVLLYRTELVQSLLVPSDIEVWLHYWVVRTCFSNFKVKEQCMAYFSFINGQFQKSLSSGNYSKIQKYYRQQKPFQLNVFPQTSSMNKCLSNVHLKTMIDISPHHTDITVISQLYPSSVNSLDVTETQRERARKNCNWWGNNPNSASSSHVPPPKTPAPFCWQRRTKGLGTQRILKEEVEHRAYPLAGGCCASGSFLSSEDEHSPPT